MRVYVMSLSSSWSKLAECPLSAREASAIAIVGQTLVMFGGLVCTQPLFPFHCHNNAFSNPLMQLSRYQEKIEGLGLEVTNDLAAYDSNNNTWQKRECSGSTPLGRTGHSFTAVEKCHKLVLFGGLNHDKGYLEDVHGI